MKLAELQKHLSHALLTETCAPALLADIAPAGTLTPSESIAVYRASSRQMLVAALRDVFPVVEELISASTFTAVAAHYVKVHPARQPYLSCYGRDFPAFLRQYEALNTLPYLCDLAELEWQWQMAHEKPAIAPLSRERLSDLMKPGARLVVSPHALLLASDYPIDQIWQWHQQTPEERSESLVLSDTGAKLLIHAVQGRVVLETLSSEAWLFLQYCAEALTMAEILEHEGEQWGQETLGALLERGCQHGWFSELTYTGY